MKLYTVSISVINGDQIISSTVALENLKQAITTCLQELASYEQSFILQEVEETEETKLAKELKELLS